MQSPTRDEPLSEGVDPSSAGTGTKSSVLASPVTWFEKYLLVLVIGGLVAGIWVASFSQTLIDYVDSTINLFMDGYGYVAPIAIFLILTPSLARLFGTRRMGWFGLFVIGWFAIRKILAGLWAVAFVFLVFRIPILPQGSLSLADGVVQTLESLGNMMLTSSYFWAMYAAVAVSVVSTRIERLTRLLEKMMDGVELAGSYLMPIIPVFMFAIGAYIYGLPENVQEQIGLGEEGKGALLDLDIWGWKTSPQTSVGMITIYVLGAVLTGVACLIWQFVFLVIARAQERRFSIIGYFTNYWIRVYPLLWATSSEALATPPNLYLAKRHAPWIPSPIRRFTVGVGSYLDINGTIINVFILGAIVLLILGLNVSVIELLLIIPVVFLISYGVPGIPGELVLFAGPMATMLSIPDASIPVFLAVYIGIQLGLPDSFRTGNNSTDAYVGSIIMNALYERWFAEKDQLTPESSPVGAAESV